MQIMFAQLDHFLTAEYGSAYSRNIQKKLKMIYATSLIMSEGKSSAYQSNLSLEQNFKFKMDKCCQQLIDILSQTQNQHATSERTQILGLSILNWKFV